MGYTLINDIIWWRKTGKITFSRTIHGNGSISYRLSGYSGRKEEILHKMILELTKTVSAPYHVFSFLKCLGNGLLTHQKPRKKYESEKGLAEDIYAHLQKTKTEPVWRVDHTVTLWSPKGETLCPDNTVALWSRGHHRKLVEYLEKSCRSRFGIDPYWNGEFYMCGFRNAESGETTWNQFWNNAISADLIVTYKEGTHIWIDFSLHQADPDEEKRICRLVKEACDRHKVKPILENIDPGMMELGYER